MILSLLIIASGFTAVPEGLKQLHAEALKQSEMIKMSESRTEQARERKSQAIGTLMPQIAGRYDFTEIDPLPGPPSPFRRINQYTAAVGVRQAVYRGDAYSAFSFARLDIDLQKRLREQEGISLWMDVAETYYGLWRAKTDVDNVKKLKEFSQERVKELKERVRIGRSRKGELMQAEAQLSTVDADLARAENAVKEAERRVEFLAGKALDPQFGPLPETIEKTPNVGVFLEKIHQRPDIKARAQEILMADKMTDIARAGHQPTIDFTANYYLLRTGIVEESEWDLGVSVSLPLFQGGTVLAATSEAAERKREVVLAYERLKRESERDITILWQNANTIEQILKDLKLAVEKSKSTYDENKKDYRYGLVTSLDVIVALNEYISTKRGYESAVIDKELTNLQLQLVVGETP
jgi:outer membrane protein